MPTSTFDKVFVVSKKDNIQRLKNILNDNTPAPALKFHVYSD